MLEAKIRSLVIRPIQSADMAFSVQGLIAKQSTLIRLGTRLPAFDLQKHVISHLAEQSDDAADKGRLNWDSQALQHILEPIFVFALAADRVGAELDQAIAQHYSLYLEWYSSGGEIADLLHTENTDHIVKLKEIVNQLGIKDDALKTVYGKEGVKTKVQSVAQFADGIPAVSKTYSAPLQISTPPYVILVAGGGMPNSLTHNIPLVEAVPKIFRGAGFAPMTEELVVDATVRPAIIKGAVTQVTENIQGPVVTDTGLVDYRYPRIDHALESLRAITEATTDLAHRQTRVAYHANLKQILGNEHTIAKLEVQRRQVAFLECFIVPPFAGVVTAVYKDIGEFANVGEPVFRLENDSALLLVGLLQFKSLIVLGMTASLEARNIFESGDSLRMSGQIVSVRGHDADDDEWDIVVEVDNTNGQELRTQTGQLKRVQLPLNFHFDRLETTVTLR